MRVEPSGGGTDQVVMDQAAAHAAVTALLRLARGINDGADVFGRQLPTVTSSWTGRFRDTFDTMASSYLAEAAALGASAAQLAANITTAVEEAAIYNTAVTKAGAAHQPPPPRPAAPTGAGRP